MIDCLVDKGSNDCVRVELTEEVRDTTVFSVRAMTVSAVSDASNSRRKNSFNYVVVYFAAAASTLFVVELLLLLFLAVFMTIDIDQLLLLLI